MATVVQPLEHVTQRVILPHVCWETYERLLADHQESSGLHFTYDQGRLEILAPSLRYGKLKHTIATLVELLAGERNIDIEGVGSTTFRRQDLARGFEPDACFYIAHAAHMRQREDVDLTVDPPPDLVIEIDITSTSLNKMPIFAALGVPEVWRYGGQQVHVSPASGCVHPCRGECRLPRGHPRGDRPVRRSEQDVKTHGLATQCTRLGTPITGEEPRII